MAERRGGRQKGTPNRKTQQLLDLCAEKGLDVFGSMIEIAARAKQGPEKFDMLEKLAQYLYPKRKAVEHSGGEDFAKEHESELAKEIREFMAKSLGDRK